MGLRDMTNPAAEIFIFQVLLFLIRFAWHFRICFYSASRCTRPERVLVFDRGLLCADVAGAWWTVGKLGKNLTKPG